MAGLREAFDQFHTRISVTSSNKVILRMAREGIRERIRKYFNETQQVNVPHFYGEGSYVMGTMVNPMDGEYAIDDGIYLGHLEMINGRLWPDAPTVYQWLLSALRGDGSVKLIGRRPRVIIRYHGLYRVEISAYGTINGQYLSVSPNGAGWQPSNPPALPEWFRCHVHLHGEQLRRIVRMIKAWADVQSLRHGGMPGGLILTILATRHYQKHKYDHVALTRTLHAIYNAVHPIFYLPNPVDIEEDLTTQLSRPGKKAFQDAVRRTTNLAVEALGLEGSGASFKIWRKILGNRFPGRRG